MANTTAAYVCSECGYKSLRPLNRCPYCKEFGTLHPEEPVSLPSATGRALKRTHDKVQSVPLDQVQATSRQRYKTGIRELDTVLGGGLVSDSAVLIGGDPGIGKSTLLLQICDAVAAQARVLYISAEESESQIQMRAQRLGIRQDRIWVCSESDITRIVSEIDLLDPDVIVMDSVQTVYSPDISSAPGSVNQVREASALLTSLAKKRHSAILIVGHVTKDGSLAGPRVLEHLVDTVLYFEGEKYDSLRILRAQKNRFGSTNEVGVFEMTEQGFREVADPSGVFLDHSQDTAGCCVSCVTEGSRALLAEVQALVAGSALGTPRISSTGLDRGRLTQLMAVLDRKCGYRITGCDVYTNVVGGMKLTNPSLDLATTAALVSSADNRPVSRTTVVCGEISLTGEVRMVPQIEKRLQEARKLGFREFVLPAGNFESLQQQPGGLNRWEGIRLIPVRTVTEALQHLFGT